MNQQPSRFMSGVQAMALGALFFSIMTVCVKMLGTRFPNQEVVFVRNFLTLVFTAGALWHRRISPLGSHFGLLLLRGLSGYLALSCFFFAIGRLPLAVATVVQFTNPIFTSLLAAVWLKESWDSRLKGSLLLGFLGVAVIARPWDGLPTEVNLISLLAALGGAILTSVAYVSIRRLSSCEEPLVVIFYFPLIGAPVSGLLSLPVWVQPTPREWAILLAVGVTAQIGQIFMTRGLFREQAGRATAVGYLQLAFASLWGFLFFAEVPDWSTALGTASIVGSVLYLRTPKPRPDAGNSREVIADRPKSV